MEWTVDKNKITISGLEPPSANRAQNYSAGVIWYHGLRVQNPTFLSSRFAICGNCDQKPQTGSDDNFYSNDD